MLARHRWCRKFSVRFWIPARKEPPSPNGDETWWRRGREADPPQLGGVRHTAPYFHDNSAKSLEEVMEHYKLMFTSNIGFPIADSNILLTDQDVADIIAFLRLL